MITKRKIILISLIGFFALGGCSRSGITQLPTFKEHPEEVLVEETKEPSLTTKETFQILGCMVGFGIVMHYLKKGAWRANEYKKHRGKPCTKADKDYYDTISLIETFDNAANIDVRPGTQHEVVYEDNFYEQPFEVVYEEEGI
jgi:hypothetical protein